jgi:Amt family ammonium transporter
VAAHGVGGTLGALLTGVFASKAWTSPADGLLFGATRQLAVQLLAVAVAIVWSAVVTFVLLKLIALFVPLRVAPREEGLGLDVSQHGEEAYAREEGAILILPEADTPRPAAVRAPAAEGGRA